MTTISIYAACVLFGWKEGRATVFINFEFASIQFTASSSRARVIDNSSMVRSKEQIAHATIVLVLNLLRTLLLQQQRSHHFESIRCR